MTKKRTKPPKVTDPRDRALGARLRELRNATSPKMTLDWVARELGCTVNQVQKYEKGENRVAYSRLCDFAKVLGVTVVAILAPLKD